MSMVPCWTSSDPCWTKSMDVMPMWSSKLEPLLLTGTWSRLMIASPGPRVSLVPSSRATLASGEPSRSFSMIALYGQPRIPLGRITKDACSFWENWLKGARSGDTGKVGATPPDDAKALTVVDSNCRPSRPSQLNWNVCLHLLSIGLLLDSKATPGLPGATPIAGAPRIRAIQQRVHLDVPTASDHGRSPY